MKPLKILLGTPSLSSDLLPGSSAHNMSPHTETAASPSPLIDSPSLEFYSIYYYTLFLYFSDAFKNKVFVFYLAFQVVVTRSIDLLCSTASYSEVEITVINDLSDTCSS